MASQPSSKRAPVRFYTDGFLDSICSVCANYAKLKTDDCNNVVDFFDSSNIADIEYVTPWELVYFYSATLKKCAIGSLLKKYVDQERKTHPNKPVSFPDASFDLTPNQIDYVTQYSPQHLKTLENKWIQDRLDKLQAFKVRINENRSLPGQPPRVLQLDAPLPRPNVAHEMSTVSKDVKMIVGERKTPEFFQIPQMNVNLQVRPWIQALELYDANAVYFLLTMLNDALKDIAVPNQGYTMGLIEYGSKSATMHYFLFYRTWPPNIPNLAPVANQWMIEAGKFLFYDRYPETISTKRPPRIQASSGGPGQLMEPKTDYSYIALPPFNVHNALFDFVASDNPLLPNVTVEQRYKRLSERITQPSSPVTVSSLPLSSSKSSFKP